MSDYSKTVGKFIDDLRKKEDRKALAMILKLIILPKSLLKSSIFMYEKFSEENVDLINQLYCGRYCPPRCCFSSETRTNSTEISHNMNKFNLGELISYFVI